MEKRRILHTSARIVFVAATVAIVLAFIEWSAHFLGRSLIDHLYAPGRIVELSAALLIYVLTVLVWEILEELKSR